jgi:hypothetical protein
MPTKHLLTIVGNHYEKITMQSMQKLSNCLTKGILAHMRGLIACNVKEKYTIAYAA